MWTSLILGLGLTLGASARPYIPDLVDVPLSQLQAQYAKRVQEEPKNAHHHYVLGRLNSMAYATQSDRFKVSKHDQQPFFGALDAGFPPRPPAHPERASRLLRKAVSEYAQAVHLDPKNLPARLGYAWCLDQAGESERARQEYRKVLKTSYAAETNGKGANFGPSMTQEVGTYLLALLDPKKDAKEIAEVQAQLAQAEKVPRAITPIMLPLQRNTPFEALVDPKAAVVFDLDGSGRRQSWTWITPRAGWLVYLQHRTRATSGLQMLGARTFWIFWRDGYQAMAALDQDDDGWLQRNELAYLKVWCDANQDGICHPRELRSLSSLSIEALATSGQPHRPGYLHNPCGVRYRDGGFGASYDWTPTSRPNGSR
jgi:tetratricopeptide (TPR) repeat protein